MLFGYAFGWGVEVGWERDGKGTGKGRRSVKNVVAFFDTYCACWRGGACVRASMHLTFSLSQPIVLQRMSEGIRRNRTRPIPAAVLPSADGQPPKASTAASAPAAAATAAVPAPAGGDKPLGSGPLGGETLSGS